LNLRTDLSDVSELEHSIREKGLIQPIVVRRSGDKFQVICGHRRLQACRNLGWKSIPALLVEASDKSAFEMAITENVQRSSLDPLEEAEAFRRYISSYGWGGVSELARRIGKSEEYVSHRVLLLDLPPSVREKISRRQLSASEATELLWLKDRDQQEKLSEIIVREGLSFRDVRAAVKKIKAGCSIEDSALVSLQAGASFTNAEACLVQLKKAIVSCRSSLFVLDSAIDNLQVMGELGEELAHKVLEQRISLHQLIDALIVEKVRLERRIRKTCY